MSAPRILPDTTPKDPQKVKGGLASGDSRKRKRGEDGTPPSTTVVADKMKAFAFKASDGTTYEMKYELPQDEQFAELWESLRLDKMAIRSKIIDEAFGSPFSSEELAQIDIQAASKLVPTLINQQRDLRLRAPKGVISYATRDIGKVLKGISKAAETEAEYHRRLPKSPQENKQTHVEVMSGLLKPAVPMSLEEMERFVQAWVAYQDMIAERIRRELSTMAIQLQYYNKSLCEREAQLGAVGEYILKVFKDAALATPEDQSIVHRMSPIYLTKLLPELHQCQCSACVDDPDLMEKALRKEIRAEIVSEIGESHRMEVEGLQSRIDQLHSEKQKSEVEMNRRLQNWIQEVPFHIMESEMFIGKEHYESMSSLYESRSCPLRDPSNYEEFCAHFQELAIEASQSKTEPIPSDDEIRGQWEDSIKNKRQGLQYDGPEFRAMMKEEAWHDVLELKLQGWPAPEDLMHAQWIELADELQDYERKLEKAESKNRDAVLAQLKEEKQRRLDLEPSQPIPSVPRAFIMLSQEQAEAFEVKNGPRPMARKGIWASFAETRRLNELAQLNGWKERARDGAFKSALEAYIAYENSEGAMEADSCAAEERRQRDHWELLKKTVLPRQRIYFKVTEIRKRFDLLQNPESFDAQIEEIVRDFDNTYRGVHAYEGSKQACEEPLKSEIQQAIEKDLAAFRQEAIEEFNGLKEGRLSMNHSLPQWHLDFVLGPVEDGSWASTDSTVEKPAVAASETVESHYRTGPTGHVVEDPMSEEDTSEMVRVIRKGLKGEVITSECRERWFWNHSIVVISYDGGGAVLFLLRQHNIPALLTI